MTPVACLSLSLPLRRTGTQLRKPAGTKLPDGYFHRDGKPRLFLSAWISDGKAKPARMVRLCPVGPPHFPMDEIRTAILSYCPTVSIEMPQDR